MTTTTSPKVCIATKKNGQPCATYALADSDFCFAHDPAQAAARAAARRAGGHARHGRKVGKTGDGKPVKIASVADVVKLLERTINDALTLENSLNRANTIGRLAMVFVKCFEVSEIEQRLAALEAQIASVPNE